MDSNDPSESDAWMADFLGDLQDSTDQFPEWEDAEDLSRLHMQSFVSSQGDGFEAAQPRGRLRLTGRGVNGHALDMAAAGDICVNFQRLVTSAGAAKRGMTSARGPIAGEVVRRTQLVLTSSPLPGSVVLDFEPASPAVEERYPDGQASTQGEETPLIEESLDTALSVLSVASNANLNNESVDALFKTLGVRVASAALALADSTSGASLDLNLSWDTPQFARRKVFISASQAATFSAILRGHGLDADFESFTGVLRTISDRRKIDLEMADPEASGEKIVVPISRGECDLSPFHLGQEVVITVQTRVQYRPGNVEKRLYTAVAVTENTATP